MALTRLAPSPTGNLHLGNARTFLINYLLARQNQWKILLRIEDIDGPRLRKGADQSAIEDLAWLGIGWDSGPVYQSHQLQKYAAAANELLANGYAYPCVCTRTEVDAAASAPHATDGAAVYPGTCRDRFGSVQEAFDRTGRRPCLRFRMPDALLKFTDFFRGEVAIHGSTLGDFPIMKADGTPAYQLACALDDAEAGVTHVIRGDDLVDSTPRQLALLSALGLGGSVPAYGHLPLVVGTDGRRLAKRHGDTRLASYREAGVSVPTILSLLAGWCGIEIDPARRPGCADDLVGRLDLRRVSRTPIVVDAASLPLLG